MKPRAAMVHECKADGEFAKLIYNPREEVADLPSPHLCKPSTLPEVQEMPRHTDMERLHLQADDSPRTKLHGISSHSSREAKAGEANVSPEFDADAMSGVVCMVKHVVDQCGLHISSNLHPEVELLQRELHDLIHYFGSNVRPARKHRLQMLHEHCELMLGMASVARHLRTHDVEGIFSNPSIWPPLATCSSCNDLLHVTSHRGNRA
mmetsp:Transcript_102634/g.180891  ORF Transcript_102634/g.180891 Transcript_102634/m.180891 type:complete len:207 (+) Transcript_102634:181-801(+)